MDRELGIKEGKEVIIESKLHCVRVPVANLSEQKVKLRRTDTRLKAFELDETYREIGECNEEHGEYNSEENGKGIRDGWMWDEGQFLDADEGPGTAYEHLSRQEGESVGRKGLIWEEWCESDGMFCQLFVAGDELGYTAAGACSVDGGEGVGCVAGVLSGLSDAETSAAGWVNEDALLVSSVAPPDYLDSAHLDESAGLSPPEANGAGLGAVPSKGSGSDERVEAFENGFLWGAECCGVTSDLGREFGDVEWRLCWGVDNVEVEVNKNQASTFESGQMEERTPEEAIALQMPEINFCNLSVMKDVQPAAPKGPAISSLSPVGGTSTPLSPTNDPSKIKDSGVVAFVTANCLSPPVR